MLIGGPDSGKTNYVGRLWPALGARKGRLVATDQPDDIGYVLDTADHLFQGHFAPHSQLTDDRRDFAISVAPASGGPEVRIVIPDISGELWHNAVLSSEIAQGWMEELRRADGALLFIRVLSNQNVRPLDWVNSRRLLAKLGPDDDQNKVPTQVILCELIRYLELTLANRPGGGRPRLAIIVAAWDLVDPQIFGRGPEAFLAKEYPFVAGRLGETTRLDVRIFGLSVVGGDLQADAQFRAAFLDKPFDECGWVVVPDGSDGRWRTDTDLTLPVAWVVGD
jgi:hypothetical protein